VNPAAKDLEMKTRVSLILGIFLLSFLTLAQTPAAAQEGPPDEGYPQQQQQQQDPPTRVARLNYSEGSVSFQPGGQGDWVQAVTNRPLTTGDNLWADQNSRAELHIGSTALRMGSETSLTFLDLDDQTTQLKLSQGTLIVRVRHIDDGELKEVDTPNLAFTMQRVGTYRISVNPAGDETDVAVWRGRGEVTGGGESYLVIAGQMARFNGTEQLNHDIQQLPPDDDFDSWSNERDRRDDRADSSNYISSEMTGYEDLDEYGSWTYAADYGPVWTPVGVAAGWAPYRYGHWVFVAPWGWTWVEDEPWGFAPFHYGRWALITGRWAWVPGPVVVRPVYAPALVAFVGGGGFVAGVAWFPLAPREVYVPWYHCGRGYVNNVNVTNTRVNVTQVTNVYNTTIINNNTTNVTRINYVNQRAPGAVTAVSHETFVNARPVSRNLQTVNEREIAEAPVTHQLAVEPSRQSMMGAGAPARVAPPRQVQARQVVATRTPPAGPTSFERPAANVRTETPGPAQPVNRGETNVPRPNEPGRQNEPMPQNQAQRPSEQPQARPQENANNVPRPGNEGGRPSMPANNGQPAAERPVPHPPASNPYVRQAPPVQNRPEVQRSEEQKFNNWQQQRQNSAPKPSAPKPAPQSHPEPSHNSSPHKGR
jgi:hypothetical protein